ncbi:hypothetical protein NQZ79_g4825 [Umbelopsis isabellina]|nr:hypothetical protein NQZ79_g4825 [Umbelopsis isabellina]
MSQDLPTHTVAVGAGAIGCVYGWRLSHNAEVMTVCRSNYDIVNQEGFIIESEKWGKGVFRPARVFRTTEEAAQVEYDYVIVTMKALPDVYDVSEIIRPVVTVGKTSVVLIQNGLGVEEPILAAYPANPLLSVVAYIASSQISPGKIKMMSAENLIMAEYRQPNVDGEQQKNRLHELFLKGDVSMKVVPDIEEPRWQKLILIAGIASTCVATDLDTSAVTTFAPSAELFRNVMRDIVAVADAYGYKYDKEQEVETMFKRVASLNAYKPSMYLDFTRNQPMEVEVILGTALRRAKQKNVNVPYLETMYAVCSALNSKKQGKL